MFGWCVEESLTDFLPSRMVSSFFFDSQDGPPVFAEQLRRAFDSASAARFRTSEPAACLKENPGLAVAISLNVRELCA